MTDPYKSLDETIAAIRQDCEARIRECENRTLAAETKSTFLDSSLTKAINARIAAERITMALLTQFSVVEKVFADAKAMALQVEQGQKPPEQPAPVVEPTAEPAPTDLTAHIEGELHQ